MDRTARTRPAPFRRSFGTRLATAIATAGLLASVLAMGQPAGAAATQQTGTDESGHTQIAWSRFVDLDFSAARIVAADTSGGHVRELTHSSDGVRDIDPSISPDGSMVAFERDLSDGSGSIGLVDADGRHERLLDLGCTDPCDSDLTPRWTPDGQHLAFTRVIGPFPDGIAKSAVLMLTDLTGDTVTRLSEPGIDGVFEDGRASFAPGGYVVFVRGRNTDGHNALFRMSMDGSNVRRLTAWHLDADVAWVSPATSGPTRDLVVFETFGHGAPEGLVQAVATVSAACRPISACKAGVDLLTPARSAPVENFNPTWSPDGRRIAFVRFEGFSDAPPRGDIWTMRSDGTNKQPFSRSRLFEFRPAWGVAT